MGDHYSRILVPEDLELPVDVIDEGTFCCLLHAPDLHVYFHIRFGNACNTAEDVAAFAVELQRINRLATGAPKRLIADVRQVRGNNHPDFESKVLPTVVGLNRTFDRFVTLTATIAGALQMQRIGRNASSPFRATTTMTEALELVMLEEENSAGHIRPMTRL